MGRILTNKYAVLALMLVLGAIIYFPSMQGGFVWDDGPLIVDNSFIKDISHVPDIFSRDWGGGAGLQYGFYRPLTIMTYMFNHMVFGPDAFWYHALNVLMHVAVSYALFLMVMMLSGARPVAFFAAIMFLVHPAQVDAVAYVSGRADMLAGLFIIMAMGAYIKCACSEKGSFFFGVSLLCFVMALFFKENSIVLPAMIAGYHWAYRKKADVARILSILLVDTAYIALRFSVMGNILGHEKLTASSMLERVPGAFAAIAGYFRIFIVPAGLHADYGARLFSMNEPVVLAGVLIAVALMVLAIKRRGQSPITSFSICWFFVLLLPVANLYPVAFYMAEHYMYMPFIGIFIMIPGWLFSARGDRRAACIALTMVVFFWTALSFKQNGYWKDPIAFYQRTLEYTPDSARMHYNLGLAYRNIGELDRAEEAYSRAIELDPEGRDAYYNLAIIYAEKGKKKESVELYKKVIGIDPGFMMAYNNLAIELAYLNERIQAEKVLKHAMKMDPEFIETYNNLGTLYLNTGRSGEAEFLYKKAIKLEPGYAKAYNNLGTIYKDRGRLDDAIAEFRKAVMYDTGYAKAYLNLSILYYLKGQYYVAVEYRDLAAKYGQEIPPLYDERLKPYMKMSGYK
ncbi:MAG: tetratricopeptide repeat protein [Candidatus Omnitrophica bacterium]|nr:tetratricopeptide repeat protein [Candidatus Omnitrophota bacterium]MDD5487836.1 tetratricopeptide repeat protein [Candidatus Omnitrophota bacterium]